MPTADDWHRVVFDAAPEVLAVTVEGAAPGDGVRVTVREQFRGYQTGASVVLQRLLDGERRLLAAGSRWLVATGRPYNFEPEQDLQALLPDTPANRARLGGWLTPAWQRAPIVVVARLDRPTARDGERRLVFAVDRVLRGPLGPGRYLDNVWGDHHLRPQRPGPTRYVLACTSAETYPGVRSPMLTVVAMQPVTDDEVDRIAASLAGDPLAARLAARERARAALSAAAIAVGFQRSALVASAVVQTRGEAMATGAGGKFVFLAPARWLRGELPPARLQRGAPDAEDPSTLAPYLFAAGGHGVYPAGADGERVLVAGDAVGEPPNVMLPETPAELARVTRFVSAAAPRFMTRPVDPGALRGERTPPPAAPVEPAFEPEIPLELATITDYEHWVRFEVRGRHDVRTPDGRVYSWIHCARRADPTPPWTAGPPAPWPDEWLFAGEALPAWTVGAVVWGYTVPGGAPAQPRGATGRVAPGGVFVPSLFVPGDAMTPVARLLRGHGLE